MRRESVQAVIENVELRAVGSRGREVAELESSLETAVNQEVAGSSPARGANYFKDFRTDSSILTGSCAETSAGWEVVSPARRPTALRRRSGARCEYRRVMASEACPSSSCSSFRVTPRMTAQEANVKVEGATGIRGRRGGSFRVG